MSTPPIPNIKHAGGTSGTTIQAEAAVLAGGVTIDTDRAGFNGTGFLNFPVTGGSAQFNGGTGGSKTISIRFANGSTTAPSRVGRILVNGVAQNITFTSDLNWTNWRTLNVTATFAAGTDQHDPRRVQRPGSRRHRRNYRAINRRGLCARLLGMNPSGYMTGRVLCFQRHSV